MIIVRLMGGLGNQMFQYAAGRRLAQHNGTNLKVDKTWFTKHQSPDAPAWREYELDCFKLEPSFADRHDLARIYMPPHSAKRRLIRAVAGKITAYIEPGSADFCPEVLVAGDNSYLEGYWQSERYFKDIEPTLRRDFTFKNPPAGKNADLLKQINKTVAVSLHVRRGDYISSAETNAVHGLTGLAYYEAAIKQLRKKVKDPTFFVFSDDPEWCKENIKTGGSTIYVDHNKKGADDMQLMSNCDYHIIANSSFSWWGAWLNPQKAKIVIAPKRWFNDPKLNSDKVLPEPWIKI